MKITPRIHLSFLSVICFFLSTIGSLADDVQFVSEYAVLVGRPDFSGQSNNFSSPVSLVRSGNVSLPVEVTVRVVDGESGGIYLKRSNAFDSSGTDPNSTSLLVYFPAESSVSTPVYVHSRPSLSSGMTLWQLAIESSAALPVGARSTLPVEVWGGRGLGIRLDLTSVKRTLREGEFIEVPVIREGPTDHAVTVPLSFSGIGVNSADFQAFPDAISLAAGQSIATIRIQVVEDDIVEGTEGFEIFLGTPPTYPLPAPYYHTSDFTPGARLVLITDAPPRSSRDVTVADASVSEGLNAGRELAFVVTIPTATTRELSFAWRTLATGTASVITEFDPASGTVTIPVGQTTATIVIPVKDDSISETDETVVIEIDDGEGAFQTRRLATGTIIDNDTMPTLTVNDSAVTDTEEGLFYAWFKCSLSGVSGRVVSFNYDTASRTAQAGLDFTPTSGTLSFLAGQTEKWLRIPLLPDLEVEPTEQFALQLSGFAGTTSTRSEAVCTIRETSILSLAKNGEIWLVRFPSGIGQKYLVEELDLTSNLGWRPNSPVLEGSGANVGVVVIPEDPSAAIFRIKVTSSPPGTPEN